MKTEKTLTSVVLVDSNMRIIPEVLDFTKILSTKGLSINSIRGYVNDLKVYYEWLEVEKLEPFSVQPSDIPRFVEYIDGKNVRGKVSPATLGRYLATLSSFYRHFEIVGGFVVENPIVKVDAPYTSKIQRKGYLRHVVKDFNNGVMHYFKRRKKRKLDKKRLNIHQALTLYQTIDEVWSKKEGIRVRNKLIFKLLYETGFRISEVLHLHVNDYDYPDPATKTGNIYLIERDEKDEDRQLKTGERTTPVSNQLLEMIDDYIMSYRPYNDKVPYIFVNHEGRYAGTPISRNAIEKVFRMIFQASGLNPKFVEFTPHALRHTHASNLHDAGVDIAVIRERLGHADIATTGKYVKPSLESMILTHERYLSEKGGIDLQ